MITDPTTAVFNELVYARRAPRTAIIGPQEAEIVTVTGTGAGTSCHFVIPAVSRTFKYGPAPCPAGAQPGQRALAVFVGAGVGDPWIVAVTTVPKPVGF